MLIILLTVFRPANYVVSTLVFSINKFLFLKHKTILRYYYRQYATHRNCSSWYVAFLINYAPSQSSVTLHFCSFLLSLVSHSPHFPDTVIPVDQYDREVIARPTYLAFLRLTILKYNLTVFLICQVFLLCQLFSVSNRDVVTMIDRRS